jgi:putative peptidoglycan lipid II flippase
MSNASSKIGRNAFSTVVSSSFGIVSSVLLDALIMGLFGMGWQTDAYFIAITIPMLLNTIIALQATRVIQPIFISKRETVGDSEAWNFVNLMMTSGTALVTVVSVAGAVCSSLLIRPQAIGSDAALVGLSTQLSVFMFLMLPLSLPIMVLRAVLHSLGSFALPGAMKFIENVFKIVFVVLVGKQLGVMSLVLGSLVGCLCQLWSFYAAARKKGYRFKLVGKFDQPEIRRVYHLMVFPLAGQACAVVVEFINNAIGSMMGAGNVSALRLATRITECFGGLLAGSIVLAAMPTISNSISKGDHARAKEDVRQSLFLLLLVTVPLSVWLALMHKPFIAILYERMKFSSADTVLVSNVLLLMIPYIFLCRLLGLFELPFFAHQDTKTPLMGSIAQAVLYIIVSLLLVGSLGIYSLPIGRSVSYLIASLFLMQLLRRRTGNLGLGKLRKSIVQILFASAVMGAFILAGSWLTPMIPASGFMAKAIDFGLPSFAGGVGLLATLLFVGILDLSRVKRAMVPFTDYSSRVLAFVKCLGKSP